MKSKFLNIIMIVGFLFCYQLQSQTKDQKVSLKGKKIILPSAVLLRIDGQKNINPLSKRIKIFTVINGSCALCIDDLKEWKTYMTTVDTSKVGFVFLVHSEDDLYTFKELNSNYIKLAYPYFHDVKKKIVIANKLMDNKDYQTFLLDNNNVVVLTGNPAKNKKTFKLYFDEINKRIPMDKPTVIIKEGVNETRFKISKGFVYKDQNGNVLQQDEGKKRMLDNAYIVKIDDDKGVITFIKK
jgi:hypothetical protein